MTNSPTRKPTARELVAARQHRQKGLPLEPAGKKPAGKEVKVVGKEPAPAVVRNDDYRDRYLNEIAPSGIVGRRIKFTKEGTFVTHDDGHEVPPETVFAALCDQTLIGWMKFNGPKVPPDVEMGLLYGGYEMPARASLDESQWELGPSGKPSDPHQHHMFLVLQDAETLELFTFDTSSPTGRRAVGNLLRHYDRMVRTHPGEVPRWCG
jgi:hypothetical protein